MHPVWEQTCEEIAMVHMDSQSSGVFSPGLSTGRSGRAAQSARSHRSSNSSYSAASAQTCTSVSTSGSHLSKILPAMGLDPLPEAGPEGHFSGATFEDEDGTLNWPVPRRSLSSTSTKQSSEGWSVDDNVEDSLASTSPGASSAGGMIGKIHNGGKIAGASRGTVAFSAPAPPANHPAAIMSL
mmetsp:Transcript_63634/g.207608  ORF Transcript_63634/g.207608 Transcript_63634/m.207608 type:complete len:183 (-) Transcript_63634:79-627(-)